MNRFFSALAVLVWCLILLSLGSSGASEFSPGSTDPLLDPDDGFWRRPAPEEFPTLTRLLRAEIE